MFDPKRKKEVFDEYLLGAMERKKLTWFEPDKPVGNYAISLLDEIILGYLVNFKEEVNAYIPTVHEWLDYAINKKEVFGEGVDIDYHHANLFQSKALANWISGASNDILNWKNALKLWAEFDDPNKSIYAKSAFKTSFLDDFLMLCVQCGKYQEGIQRFEHYHGVKEISIKRKPTPREYGYLLCRNALEPKYNQTELSECGERMLTRYIQEPWLRMGMYGYAATWLKIVYWDQQVTNNAFETIQKAYDCMPDVERL